MAKQSKSRVWIPVSIVFVILAATTVTLCVIFLRPSAKSVRCADSEYEENGRCFSCNCTELTAKGCPSNDSKCSQCNCTVCSPGQYKSVDGFCTECHCSGHGLYQSKWNAVCNPQNGDCACNPSLNIEDKHCYRCKSGFRSRNVVDSSVPGQDGCPVLIRSTVAIPLFSEADSLRLINNVAFNPGGGNLTSVIEIPGLGALAFDAPSGILSQDDVRLSVSYYNVTDHVAGLPDEISPVALLDMVASADDAYSDFELFGRVFLSNMKISLDSGQNDSEILLSYFYDEETGALESTGVATGTYQISSNSSTVNGTKIQFYTQALGKIVLLSLSKEKVKKLVDIGSLDTGFVPELHGWTNKSVNQWPTYTGMALFARWFYLAYSDTPLFTESDSWPEETLDRTLTMLQLRCSDSPPEPTGLSDRETVEVLIHSLYSTRSPQVLVISYYNGINVQAGHALVVFKYEKDVFSVYDPAEGPLTKELRFDKSTGKFKPYGSRVYNRFYVYSHKAFQLTLNDMDVVYASALSHFTNDSNDAVRIVLDDVPSNITEDSLTVTGNVSVLIGAQRPSSLFFYAIKRGSEGISVSQGKAELSPNGFFSKVLVDFQDDEYKIVLLAVGYRPSTDNTTRTKRSERMQGFYNRAEFAQTELNSSHPPEILRVRLTWEDDASDIDLHVLEPGSNGTHVFYSSKSGHFGYLDYDNTAGLGPEHYIIRSSNNSQDPPTGQYKIRIHYFSNHDVSKPNRSIRWLVKARIGSYEDLKTFSGVLTKFVPSGREASNFSSNDGSWSKTFVIDVKALSFIAIADRPVANTFGLLFQYSIQFWNGVFILPSKSKNREEEEVEKLRQLNPTATSEGLELLRYTSDANCSAYQAWMLYEKQVTDGKCWKKRDVAISRISYQENGTKFIPILQDNDSSQVQIKWTDVLVEAKSYRYAEQPGTQIKKFPLSIYCVGEGVNNSNTFIRWLILRSDLKPIEMTDEHPGRDFPEDLTNLEKSFFNGVFCSADSPPPLADSSYTECLSTLVGSELYSCL